MLSKESVWQMFQNTYFDSVDKGEMAKAVSVFHDDVEWIHTQVWEHDDYRRDKGSDRLKGKNEVKALLEERKTKMGRQNIRHLIQDLVLDGSKGAFLAHVKGGEKELGFIVWFELKDEKIYRYIVAPL